MCHHVYLYCHYNGNKGIIEVTENLSKEAHFCHKWYNRKTNSCVSALILFENTDSNLGLFSRWRDDLSRPSATREKLGPMRKLRWNAIKYNIIQCCDMIWHDVWYNMIKYSIIWYSAMCDTIWLRIHRPCIHWWRLQSNFLWWNVCLLQRGSAAHDCFHRSAGQVTSLGIPNGRHPRNPQGVTITPAFPSAKRLVRLPQTVPNPHRLCGCASRRPPNCSDLRIHLGFWAEPRLVHLR